MVSNQPYLVSGLAMVVATIALYMAALGINMLFFSGLEFAPGISWVYLPAGVRLLTTLLFGEFGGIGLLLVSWGVNFYIFFPNDPARAFVGGLAATAAPYAVYIAARRRWAFGANLANLTPSRLLLLALACSLANPLLNHLWFVVRGDPYSLQGFVAMFTGDIVGTVVVLYGAKLLLFLLDSARNK